MQLIHKRKVLLVFTSLLFLVVRCNSSYNSIDHGVVRGTLGASSCNNSYNCRLDFRCFDGYYLDARDNKIAICQANGQWSASKPTCKRKFGLNIFGLIKPVSNTVLDMIVTTYHDKPLIFS